jgi:uncharacterized FlgJ-related protein
MENNNNNNRAVDQERVERAKQMMKEGALAVAKALAIMLLKTWVAMVAINWLDLLKHPLTFWQTFVLAFVANMLFGRSTVVREGNNLNKINTDKDGNRNVDNHKQPSGNGNGLLQ